MVLRERVTYITIIVVLTGILIYSVFLPSEDYVEDYNIKIEALERKVDSLHSENGELTFQIDTLNNKIKAINQSLVVKDSNIKQLKTQINEKINNVDSFDGDELQQFFTNRYRQLKDSIE